MLPPIEHIALFRYVLGGPSHIGAQKIHSFLPFGKPEFVLVHTLKLPLFEMGDREGFVKGLLVFRKRCEVKFGAALVIKEKIATIFEFQRGVGIF